MQGECRPKPGAAFRRPCDVASQHFPFEWQEYRPILAVRRKIRDATQGGTLSHDEEFAMRLSANHTLTVTPDRNAGTSPSKSALPGFVGSLLASARSWLARRAVLAELHGLDDRTMADLRIYPGDFQAIADGTYIREGGAHDVARQTSAQPSSAGRRPYY
jgi:uncharacterized protein YjiS (DUF1127 family)